MIGAFLKVRVNDFYSRGNISAQELNLLESYSQLRTAYVLQEKWPLHHGGVDYDEYDAGIDSCYIVASEGQQVVAGMRLTRVNNINESLSYAMWQNAIDYDKFHQTVDGDIVLRDKLAGRQVWDVTRLITEASVLTLNTPRSRVYSRIGLFKIMARGVDVVSDEQDPVWVFTTTKKLVTFLQKMKFETGVIFQGRISASDSDDSYLCMVYPRQIMEQVHRTNKTLSLIARHSRRRK